jgi:hypothetical protein
MASGRATMPAKFGVGDTVRFIGTSTSYTVNEYNPDTLEFRVQRGDEPASSQWASEIYLELISPARPAEAQFVACSS